MTLDLLELHSDGCRHRTRHLLAPLPQSPMLSNLTGSPQNKKRAKGLDINLRFPLGPHKLICRLGSLPVDASRGSASFSVTAICRAVVTRRELGRGQFYLHELVGFVSSKNSALIYACGPRSLQGLAHVCNIAMW